MISLRNILQTNQKEKIQSWVDDYSMNKETLENMINENADFTFLKDYQSFDASAAWDKIEPQIANEAPQHQARTFSLVYKVAAAVAVLLLAVFAIKPYIGNTNNAGLQSIVYESKDKLSLPDGSMITVDKGAVAFNEASFTDERTMTFEGRAYFDIAKSTEGKNFVIENEQFDVEILGTEFEINTLKSEPTVIVTEGKVKITTASESVIITANEAVKIIGNKIIKEDIQSGNIASWMSGQLEFKDVAINQIATDLSHHFNIPFELSNSDANCRWSSSFSNESIESILTEMSAIFNSEYTVKADKVVLSNINCK